MRRPPVVLGMALLTCMALLVAVLLILFSVNPSVDRNEGEIRKAVMSQHAIICAQVQNTANAYRFRSLTPSGDVEPIRHFLTRMQAQQQTLRLARGSECRSAPGFPPVGLQVKRALHQINEILQHFAPKLREPVRNASHTSGYNPKGYRHPSFSPAFSKPPKAGVGEEGVPAKLHKELAPSAPVQPQGGNRHSVAPEEVPEPEATPAPEPPVEEQATRIVEPPPRPKLPSVPIKVELSIESEEP